MRFATFVVLAALLAPSAAAQTLTVQGFDSFYTHPASLEIEESNPADRAEDGQKNCVVEAATGATTSCPLVVRSMRPFSGVRMLDAMALQDGWQDPSGDLMTTVEEPGNVGAAPGGIERGANPRASSGGRLHEVVLPGRYTLWAWYGVWNDTNGDGDVRIALDQYGKATPTNEWIAESGSTLHAYVEPGPRPPLLSATRPHKDTPDVTLLYHSGYRAYRAAGEGVLMVGLSPVVFLDGSLLQEVRATTVAEAILTPDGTRPYTLTGASLVDVDVAPATAPSLLVETYEASLAPAMNTLGSPSLGWCPGACRASPAAATGTPVEGPVGEVGSTQYFRTPREWELDSGSSSAGRRDAFNESYTPWGDLVVTWSPWAGEASRFAGPVPGRTQEGGRSAAPGVLAFDAWAGIWKDLDRDGFVGAAGGDPYAGGSRPAPDDYANPSGEFHGVWPSTPASPARASNVILMLTPDDRWEDVVVLDNQYGSVKCGSKTLLDAMGCATSGTGWTVSGEDPLRFSLVPEASDNGRLVATSALLLPFGSPGFTACTAAMYVRHGVSEAEWVHDCDHFGRWEGRP